MTIGSPSGSGATQTDIADGADESDGRWQFYRRTSTVGSQPAQTVVSGVGATPSFNSGGAEMSSASVDDTGKLEVINNQDVLNLTSVSAVLFKIHYKSSTGIGSLSDDHGFGFQTAPGSMVTLDDIAIFYPTAGDFTSANVRVDNNGTDTDGKLDYPDITETHSYTILIDIDGTYISSGATGFYVDGDPRKGDSPNVELSVQPDLSADFRGFGGSYNSNGNSDTMHTPYLEMAVRF